jgi:hypothetical protein
MADAGIRVQDELSWLIIIVVLGVATGCIFASGVISQEVVGEILGLAIDICHLCMLLIYAVTHQLISIFKASLILIVGTALNLK